MMMRLRIITPGSEYVGKETQKIFIRVNQSRSSWYSYI